jgi:hypothetical protein
VFEAANGESVTSYSDRVDSNRCGVNLMNPTPFAGENPQSCKLGRGYRLERMPVPIGPAGFDLDKSDGSSVASNDVDFTVTAAPTSIDDLVAVRDEKIAGDGFTPSAQFVFVCHCSSPNRVGHMKSAQADDHPNRAELTATRRCVKRLVITDGKVAGQLKFLFASLFDVDVLEGQNLDRLHETVSSIDIPHPHIGERQFEIEIIPRFFDDLLNVIGKIKASFRFDDIRELSDDIAVFAEQLQFGVAIVGVKVIIVHRGSFYSFGATGNTEDNHVRR